MAGFNTVRPIKAIFQSDGDVVLGEFTDNDSVEIAIGGTGGTSASEARSNLELIQYTIFNNYADFDLLPENGRLAQDLETGKLYFSVNNEWQEVGSRQIVNGTDVNGVYIQNTEVEVLNFSGNLIYEYDPNTATGTVSVDLSVIENRLDTIEGDESVTGSIQYHIKERIGNFEYESHTQSDIDNLVADGVEAIGLVYDTTTGKYKAAELDPTVGAFVRFYNEDGSRDDLNMIATYDGADVISAYIRFWNEDGTQDNIDW